MEALTGRSSASRAWRERAAHGVLALCAALAVTLVVTVVWTLLAESLSFFRRVSIVEFFTTAQWTPLFEDGRFGVLPLLTASIQITLGATLVAVPIGLLTAVYLQEIAHRRVATLLRLSLDLLAGVPTVVYGYFALTFVTPILQGVFPETEVFNWASASLVVGLMIVPTVAALSQEALSAVPTELREAAYGLGATRGQVVARVLMPAALPGIVASVVLAMARAVGETMTVTLAAGNQARLTLNPLEGAQTMTAFIAQVSLGDTPSGTIEYETLFAVGTVLFVLTFTLTATARAFLRRQAGVAWSRTRP